MILNKRCTSPGCGARTVYPLIGGFDLRRIDSQSVRKHFFFLFCFGGTRVLYTFHVYVKDRYSKSLSFSSMSFVVKRHATLVSGIKDTM